MIENKDGFNGTIDLFKKPDSLLLKIFIASRKRQKCSFSIIGTEIRTGRDWNEWKKMVNSLWSREHYTLPGAILSEKEINPGPVFSLPEKFRFLVIPCFTGLPLELDYLELFSFIRTSGGLICLIPPLNDWQSPACGLSNMDLCTVMVNGKEDFSTALYHLNHRTKAGFIGINQMEKVQNDKESFNRLFPLNYKLSEHDIFRCFKTGKYSISNSCNNSVKCVIKPTKVYQENIICDKISFELSCLNGKMKTEFYKNGNKFSQEELSPSSKTKYIQIKGKEYCFIRTSNADFHSVSAPVFISSPHQLWGDHHVHYIFKNGLTDARMDYVAYGLYGQVQKYDDFPNIIPGGEIHGTVDRGTPDNLHFLVVQKSFDNHFYKWEPGEGTKKTLERAKKFRDFIILAHPGSRTSEYLPQTIHPDGIEILHGFSLFAFIMKNYPELLERAKRFFATELVLHTREDSVKNSRALWDSVLCKGKKCLGFGNGDLHGPAFHGQFANNLGVGYPVSVINAENADPSKVYSYLHTGNTWFTNTGFYELSMKMNKGFIGMEANLSRNNRVELTAASCFPITQVRFISQNKSIKEISCNAHEIGIKTSLAGLKIKNYLRAELTDNEGNIAFTNPIYIK